MSVQATQMSQNGRQGDLDTLAETHKPSSIVLLVIALIGGAAAATIVLPLVLPGWSGSVVGAEPKAFWYLSRAAGTVAYGLLWLSMAVGLGITNKLARLWPGAPAAFDLHQHLSLLGLAFALFHAVVLLGDKYMSYDLAQLFLPFGSSAYRQVWVGLGQVSFYLLVVVGFSFYFRKRIGNRWWRAIHFASFAVFALALAHGLMSGTDSGTIWAAGIYWLSAGSLLFLTVYRVLAKRISQSSLR